MGGGQDLLVLVLRHTTNLRPQIEDVSRDRRGDVACFVLGRLGSAARRLTTLLMPT